MNTLGVGIDLVDVHRIEEMIERKADRVFRKLLTDSETDYCLGKAIPAQHIAARIAAKAATNPTHRRLRPELGRSVFQRVELRFMRAP